MTYDDKKLRELIPLYINGTLPEKKRREFEKKLEEYPELKNEYREFLEIKSSYVGIQQKLPQPSEAVFQRVMDGIKGKSKKAEISLEPGIFSKLQEFISQFFASPRLSWAVATVQLVVILGLVTFISTGDRFTTLTSDDPHKGKGIAINIVFDEEAREREIRSVLNRIGAVIVSGPSAEGVYVIAVNKDKDTDDILVELRRFDSVRFADKAY